MLTPWLKLSGDVAYLPIVHFGGVDNHPQRTDGPSTRSPAEGHGTGVQVEGVISYDVTSEFRSRCGRPLLVHADTAGTTNFFSGNSFINQRFAAEQTAVFVQGSYKFAGPSD